MNLFVIGGAGFIGPHVVRTALADGWRVAVYDNFARGTRTALDTDVSTFEGDVCDGDALRRACESFRPDAIVHAAAHHFIPWCVAHPDATLEANVQGTLTVARTTRALHVRRVVFTSTADVYSPQVRPHTEQDKLGSPNIYGASKIAGEAILRAFATPSTFDLYILRLFNVVGPGETNPHFIPELIANARRGRRVPVGNLAPVRDYVHARDVATACLICAEGLIPPETYNVATGIGHSGEEVIAELRTVSGIPLETFTDPARMRPSDRPVLIGSPARLTDTKTWRPSTTLRESLQELWGDAE